MDMEVPVNGAKAKGYPQEENSQVTESQRIDQPREARGLHPAILMVILVRSRGDLCLGAKPQCGITQ